MIEGDGQHVQRERAGRRLCGVSKNIEKNILVFVFWLNIACNVLICGEKNKHCLQVHLLVRGNARAVYYFQYTVFKVWSIHILFSISDYFYISNGN